MRLNPRPLFLVIFLTSVGLLACALYLQEVEHLLPCPLCVVQRVAYWLVGVTAVLAFVHNPRKVGRRIYSGLLTLFALAGALVALRHAWLVRHPGGFECGISPEEAFLNALPLARWWPAMFEANGDCAKVTWKFMLLSIPDWSFLFFVLFAGIAVYLFFRRRD
jgi:disulfide bond formation protein DsbB